MSTLIFSFFQSCWVFPLEQRRQSKGIFTWGLQNAASPCIILVAGKPVNALAAWSAPAVLPGKSKDAVDQPFGPPRVPPRVKIEASAGVMELVDMQDLGSCASGVWVRVPSPAPKAAIRLTGCRFSVSAFGKRLSCVNQTPLVNNSNIKENLLNQLRAFFL